MSFPVIFHMWNPGPIDNCTVIEAALATCAAPGIIAGVAIKGQAGLYTTYIGADLRWNNPAMSVLQKATKEFPGRGNLVIVSIRTGKEGVIAIEHCESSQLTETLKKIARDCEETSERVSKHCDAMGWEYFRLNVDQGVQGLAWKEWDKNGSVIQVHTASYLRQIAVEEKLGLLVESIRPMIEPPPAYAPIASVGGPQDSAYLQEDKKLVDIVIAHPEASRKVSTQEGRLEDSKKLQIRAVAFSRDGTRIVSGSGDNSVRVWDASTGEELQKLKGHTSSVNSVAFSTDGSRTTTLCGCGMHRQVWRSRS